MPEPITLIVGDTELAFNIEDEDVNDYINALTPTNKVGPSWNMLARTSADIDALKRIALNADGKPKGMLVSSMAAELVKEVGGDIDVTVKKPSAAPKALSKTASVS